MRESSVAVRSTSRSRLFWGMADQGASSLGNVLLPVAVARTADAETFGAVTVALTAYLLAIGISRALSTDALVVIHRHLDPVERARAPQEVSAAAVLVGLFGGAACVGAGFVVSGTLKTCLLILGIAMPLLLLQDCWRFVFIAHDEPHRAFLNDSLWLACQIGLFGLLVISSAPAAYYLLAWAAGAGVAAAAGAIRLVPQFPHLGNGYAWWRRTRGLSNGYLVEFVSGQAAVFFSTMAVVAVAGLQGAGAYRGGQVLTGVLNVVVVGALAVTIAEGTRLENPARLRRFLLIRSASLASLIGALGAALILLPSSAGESLLGDTWSGARELLLPLVLVTVGNAFVLGGAAGLRVLQMVRQSVVARAMSGAASLTGAIGGALIAEEHGAAWGMAVGVTIGAGVWWTSLSAAVARTAE